MGRVTLFSQTFHRAHKLELLHCHFWYCYIAGIITLSLEKIGCWSLVWF